MPAPEKKGISLEEAIKILTEARTNLVLRGTFQFQNAMELGNESLKELKRLRKLMPDIIYKKLPGETEE